VLLRTVLRYMIVSSVRLLLRIRTLLNSSDLVFDIIMLVSSVRLLLRIRTLLNSSDLVFDIIMLVSSVRLLLRIRTLLKQTQIFIVSSQDSIMTYIFP
jgi:hypothetical protein